MQRLCGIRSGDQPAGSIRVASGSALIRIEVQPDEPNSFVPGRLGGGHDSKLNGERRQGLRTERLEFFGFQIVHPFHPAVLPILPKQIAACARIFGIKDQFPISRRIPRADHEPAVPPRATLNERPIGQILWAAIIGFAACVHPIDEKDPWFWNRHGVFAFFAAM